MGRRASSGRIPALSLSVWLTDIDGRALYHERGGIQLLGRVNIAGTLVDVPRSELFANNERNANAVRLALDPLLGAAEKK